jgi:hypothetical protein
VAEKTVEVDFFKGGLQKGEGRRQKHGASGETASTSESEPSNFASWTSRLLS